MSELPATRRAELPADLAARRAMAQRRRRVWRNVIVILLITCVMVLLSMAERDNQAVRGAIQNCVKNLEFACNELEQALRRGQPAPTKLPLPAEEEPPSASPAEREAREDAQLDRLLHYIYDPFHRKQLAPGKTVIVGYCAKPHQLFLHEDRRQLILFDGQHYRVESVKDSEFRQRARDLGLQLPR